MHVPRLITRVALLFVFATSTATNVDAQGSVSVTPDEGTETVVENSAANQVTFTITNTVEDTEHADAFELICNVAGSVSSCQVSTESVFLEAQQQTSVTVTFATSAAGKGVVALIAWGTNWRGYDPAHYKVTVESAASK